MSELELATSQLLANSITGVGGDSDLELGDGDVPGEADAKGDWSIWD